jgi:hypothetical protein
MDALLLDAPEGRCLLSLLLGASTPLGSQGAHIRIEVRGQPMENAPLIAAFEYLCGGLTSPSTPSTSFSGRNRLFPPPVGSR